MAEEYSKERMDAMNAAMDVSLKSLFEYAWEFAHGNLVRRGEGEGLPHNDHTAVGEHIAIRDRPYGDLWNIRATMRARGVESQLIERYEHLVTGLAFKALLHGIELADNDMVAAETGRFRVFINLNDAYPENYYEVPDLPELADQFDPDQRGMRPPNMGGALPPSALR